MLKNNTKVIFLNEECVVVDNNPTKPNIIDSVSYDCTIRSLINNTEYEVFEDELEVIN